MMMALLMMMVMMALRSVHARDGERERGEPPFTWVDHRRTGVLTSEERCTLLGFVHHTTIPHHASVALRAAVGANCISRTH
jgi:hypothetical protein